MGILGYGIGWVEGEEFELIFRSQYIFWEGIISVMMIIYFLLSKTTSVTISKLFYSK
jgi:hypothetical protein